VSSRVTHDLGFRHWWGCVKLPNWSSARSSIKINRSHMGKIEYHLIDNPVIGKVGHASAPQPPGRDIHGCKARHQASPQPSRRPPAQPLLTSLSQVRRAARPDSPSQ